MIEVRSALRLGATHRVIGARIVMLGIANAAEDAIGPSEHGSMVCPAKLPRVIQPRLATGNSSARSKSIPSRQVLRDEKRQMASGGVRRASLGRRLCAYW